MHNRSFRDDVVFILSESPSGIRVETETMALLGNRTSERAGHSATEIRGDLSHSLAFNSFDILYSSPEVFW